MTKEEIMKSYLERENRWTNKTLEQLSFISNLLLTLSVGFLSFSYEKKVLNSISSTCNFKEIDWPLTFTIISVILISIAILTGLIVAINRLFDFRLTRNINQIRRRIYKHANQTRLDETSPEKFNLFQQIILPYQILFGIRISIKDNTTTFKAKYCELQISIENCKGYLNSNEEIKTKLRRDFRALRNIAHNLGLNTWNMTFAQIILFAVSIICYVIGQL